MATSARVSSTQIYQAPQPWQGDGVNSDTILPGGAFINASQFPFSDGVTVKVTANAAADVTSLTVTALSGIIPSGTILNFGTKKFAMLTAAAAAGATTLAVAAIPTAIAANDTATYTGGSGRKPIPSGTLVGRTYTERDAGAGFGPADVTNDDEIYLLAQDVPDAVFDPQCILYRHNCLVYEERLPNWGALTTAPKAKIRDLYQCMK